MLEILKKTIKTGCQTTKYPAVPDIAPERFRGKPEFTSNNCTYCGECVKACPPGVILLKEESGEKMLSVSYCGCIFCARCEEVCRFDAIKLTQDYELASKSKEDLVTSIRRML